MQLSIIIVNYNVRHFLEQCLYSVQKAAAGMQCEVVVIDNNSTDGSIQYLSPNFPQITFIANNENIGFAKACNQGLAQATGKYILFLNPDTIVPEDCFEKCISFLATNISTGALGIRMLDGSGKFLKESKRAFPDPVTSLFKLFGFANLFPRSKTFARYHLGHLDEHKTNEVDVLAGAFMMVKKEVLDLTGGFDETFFMYGEDVDLSYRIQQTNCAATGSHYKNYYFADSSIIHFKGESTRKGSMNYVRMFYNAMSIFVRKHYGGNRAGIFNFLIHVAIWFRGGLSAIANFIRRIGLPLIDAIFICLAYIITKYSWSTYIRKDILYSDKILWVAIPAYTVFFLITAYYAGLYDRWYKQSGLIRSMLVATIFLLAGYSLLPEQYRFSRGIIFFGSLLAFVFISLLRWILVRTGVLTSNKDKVQTTSTLIAGSLDEYNQVNMLLKEAGLMQKVLGRLSISENDKAGIGNWKQAKTISGVIPFREIIFCQGELSFKEIIDGIETMPKSITVKIHASGSGSIVGSNQQDSSGEAISKENGFRLSDPYNKRLKRLVDIGISLFGIIIFPLMAFIVKKPLGFIINCIMVLTAKKTWIGYAAYEPHLPDLRPGIIASNGLPVSGQQLAAENLHMVDYWYARDYEIMNDLKLIWKVFRKLGG